MGVSDNHEGGGAWTHAPAHSPYHLFCLQLSFLSALTMP